MTYPYIPPPSAEETAVKKAWELVDFITEKLPPYYIKIEMRCPVGNFMVIAHESEVK